MMKQRPGSTIVYVRFRKKEAAEFIRKFRAILANGNTMLSTTSDYIAGLHFLMGAGRLPDIRVAHVHNPSIAKLIMGGATSGA